MKNDKSAKFGAASIIDYLPLKLVLYLATPYLAGKDYKQAVKTAHQIFASHHFCGTLDILGEDAKSVEDCEFYRQAYFNLIEEMLANPLPIHEKREELTVSVKPSMFCIGAPANEIENKAQQSYAFERITKVVDYAAKRNIRVTLEAEDNRWTDFHLNSYIALFNAGYSNLGTVLQTRLFRTAHDVERFVEGMRVRLVIGIYEELPSIAHTNKNKMKDLLVKYAGLLLAKGVYVEIATHDSLCIEKFFQEIVLPQNVPATQFETQFLLGVPRMRLQRALVSGGYFRSWDPLESTCRHASLSIL